MGKIVATCVVIVLLALYLFEDTLRHHDLIAEGPGQMCVLRFRHFGGYEDYQLWRDVIADFERACPEVSVRQEYSTANQSLYHAKLRQEILANMSPEVAIVQLGPFAELAGNFEALEAVLKHESPPPGHTPPSISLNQSLIDALDPQAVRAFQVHGTQRGLPISGGTLLVYCNPDCFDRAARIRGHSIELPGFDWDMSVFKSLAEDLTLDIEGDGRIEQFGFFHPRWVYALPLVWSFGADVVDPVTMQWRLTGESAEAALTFYKGLLTDRRVCPREEELPLLVQDIAFLTGRTAMCINGPWFEPFLRRTHLADRYVVAPIPRGPAGRWTRVTWDGVVVTAGLDDTHRRAAHKFVAFVLSSTAQDRIAASGRAIPVRRLSWTTFVRGDRRECRAAFVDSLHWARLEPLTPGYLQLDAALNREMQRFLAREDQRTAREFLDDLRRDPVVLARFGDGGSP